MSTNFIDAIFSSTETTVFVILIAALTIYFGHIRFTRFSLAHGPEILTTLGIMGCFVGIALALLEFDSKNIQQSVPLLLQGVKTAFWSSVAGVTGALWLRFLHHVRKPPVVENPENIKAASLDDVVLTMVALRQGLVGDEQGTLLTQMKLQRQESKDKLDELVFEFKNFARHMTENNQKAIIEALREVISDFNTNLTEQFGENFKQLNSAVERLVVWQQQYMQELQAIKSSQQQSAEDMKLASAGFSEMVGNASHFADTAEKLRNQIEHIQQGISTLYQQETALAEVLVTMREVTPTFATKVDDMLDELKDGMIQIERDMQSATKSFGTQVQSTSAELKHVLSEVMTKYQNELGDELKRNVGIIKEGVLTLDTALQKELNDALQSLGRQLASLSNRFVEDYTPLTERLREVVRIGKVVQQ